MAGIAPGLDGFLVGQQQAQSRDTAQLGQLSTLLQIAGAAHKQQQERAYQGEMAGADTPEKQLAVAVKYGGPTAVMGHHDRTTKTQQTQALALQNLDLRTRDTLSKIQARADATTDGREKEYWNRQYKELAARADAERINIARGNFFDTTGQGPGYGSYQPYIPQTAPQLGGQPAAADPLAGRPQNEIDAIRMVQNGATSANALPGQPAAIVRGPEASGAAPGASPMPQPSAPVAATPVLATPPAPVDREIARLPQPVNAPGVLAPAPAAAQAGPVTPGQVIASPAAAVARPQAQMPEFTGSPKEIRTEQNKWIQRHSEADVKPPKDFMWNPSKTEMVVIPGSQTDIKMKQVKEKDLRNKKILDSTLDAEIANIDKLIGNDAGVKPHPGLAQAVGPVDTRFPTVFTSTADAEALIKSLQSKASISSLQTIRATAGAIGSLTEKEWPRLESLKATLQETQGTKQFTQSLKDYRNELLRIKRLGAESISDTAGVAVAPGQSYSGPDRRGVDEPPPGAVRRVR